MPTSALLMVVRYAYVSSSDGGCFICTSALLMVVVLYAHVSSSGGGGVPCLSAR